MPALSGLLNNVVFIILENTSLKTVQKFLSVTPYLKTLLPTGCGGSGTAAGSGSTNYIPTTQPSAPNYLALTCGRNLQAGSDAWNPYSFQNIIDLLVTAGVPYGMYAENLPSNWEAHQDSGLYAQRHFPFGYYTDVYGNSSRTPNAQKYDQSSGTPNFIPGRNLANTANEQWQWITPNLTDDAHTPGWGSGGAQNCNAWLAIAVPHILNSTAFGTGKKAVLIIIFDESETTPETATMCLFLGPSAPKNFTSNVKYTHYSMLATWETMLGLGNLGQNDATALTMSDMYGVPGGSTDLPTWLNKSFSSETFTPVASTQGGNFNPSLGFAALSSEKFAPAVSGTQIIHPAISCGTASGVQSTAL
jgi:hypothetical protein